MAKKKIKTGKINKIVDPLQWAQDYLPTAEYDQLLRLLESNPLLSIRINLLKPDPLRRVQNWISNYSWNTSPIPFCPSGYWVSDPKVPLSRTIEHQMGYYYIQEAASMLPSELFDLSELDHPLILDMAASPGGKTIHLIDRTKDKGLIIANDASKSRISALRIVLQNWGAINQVVTCMPGERFGSVFKDVFDAVLLDAPCSMQGLRISPSHKMRPITENEIISLSERQVNLLESALHSVKIGGQVVYSTCTLSPMENENVISQILDKYKDSVLVEDIQKQLSAPASPMLNFGEMHFNEEVKRTARLWPHIFGTAGFFCAKFIKKDSLTADLSPRQFNKTSVKDRRFLTDKESDDLTRRLADIYGFNLGKVIEDQSLIYKEFNDEIHLVPHQHLDMQKRLPILSQGMMIGKQMPKGWQPSHEFVSRFGEQFTESIFTLEEKYISAWTRGEDIRGIQTNRSLLGKVALVRDEQERNLGRGKMLADRLKNMLPTRLF